MAPAGPPRPRLLLLGDFQLMLDGADVRVTPSAKRVLAHLAVRQRRRGAPRAQIAERLWPDTPPGRATSNLRSAIWRLPRWRGRQVVTATADTVALATDVEVDLWEAEALAARLCASPTAELGGAEDLRTLAHDLLPDWAEDWLDVEREGHRQQRLHALEQASALLRTAGRYPDALVAGLTAVNADALRETAHRRVIEVHLSEGNHAEALHQFDRYRRLMARELGLPPSPAIRRLVSPLVGRPLDL